MPNEFLEDLFGSQDGIVYAPTIEGRSKERPKGYFKQHFFAWPQERQELEAHIEDYNNHDVYLSPVLFSDRKISPETFRGTNYLWTEFDGVVPNLDDTVKPTMRILSSQEGHEHWYWRLNEFTTDQAVVTDLTKRIAYAYGADPSVWDYQNVLRPPDTWNHKHNKPVTLVTREEQTYSVNDFTSLPIVESVYVDVDLGKLPPKELILAKYSWKEDTFELLFKKEVKEGKRSDALARLAYDAIEVGCSNEETFTLIEFLDSNLKKFVGRPDRHRRLEEIVSHVRTRFLNKAELEQTAPEVYGFYDFMQTDIVLKWAIEGLLPVAGSFLLLGTEGIGKTTLLLRLAEALGLEQDHFLIWKIVRKQKVLFVSLEMSHEELKQFFIDMELSEEDQKYLQENFIIWPIGHSYSFDSKEEQKELLKYIDIHKIDLVVLDSLGTATGGSIKDDETIKDLNKFLNEELRKKRKCSYGFIHHLRKKGINEVDKETDLDESFGSKYITTNAQTIMLFAQKKGSPNLTVKLIKTRHTIGARTFEVKRTPNRGFVLVDDSAKDRPEVTDKEGTTRLLGNLLGI